MAPTSQKSKPKPKPKQSPKKGEKKPKKIAVHVANDDSDDSKPGCIYIGHIPHGFYEDQMTEYFGQFGHVLAVKICRSKKSGNSKGYGFVKFRYAAVAKTVAETCNNYLFLNKLLKCEFKPMSEIHKGTFMTHEWRPKTAPRRKYNNSKTELHLVLGIKKSLSKAEQKMIRLKGQGLDVELDQIMDVPDMSQMDNISAGRKRKAPSDDSTTALSSPEPPSKKTNSSPSTPSPSPSKQKASAATPKSNAKSKAETVSTPKSESKKKTGKVSTPKSDSKKKTGNVSTPKSDSKKKTGKVSTPKSDSKKKTGKVSTPKSDSKRKMEQVSTPKSESKKKATKVTTPSSGKGSVTPKTSSMKKKTEMSIKEKKSPKSPKLSTPPAKRGRRSLK